MSGLESVKFKTEGEKGYNIIPEEEMGEVVKLTEVEIAKSKHVKGEVGCQLVSVHHVLT